ncbi:MAG: glycerol-3-phosphate dehydrogenase/oxidase, partial [Gemmatimonadaceae bacterium]
MSPNQASGASGLTPWRIDAWTAAATQEFDLVVVGGGITGAGIARDATLRGLRVALFEKADFANGTSGRSSRLVHGGLRYLEHGHLRLVREASRERRTLLRIAPHLVRPLAFTWPLYEGARIPQWKLRAGLALYDALAFYRNVSPHRRLTPEEVRAVEPKLLAAGLRGGVRYFDAGADDARLVLANAIAAAEQGAVVLNYASVELVRRVTTPGRSAWIVEVRDALNGAAAQCRTRAVVMALGPWSGDAPALAGEAVPSGQIVPSAGAHIALPRRLVGNAGALTLLSPVDDRVMFVLGDGDLTIVTTTESPTGAPADDVRASAADVRYLLAAVTHYFPGTDLGPADVVAAWAGVRPLTLSSPNVKHPLTAVSREHAISEVDSRLIVVTGGKLTTYRSMAEEVVDRVAAALGRRVRRAVTDRVPLPGGELSDVRAAISAAERTTGERD